MVIQSFFHFHAHFFIFIIRTYKGFGEVSIVYRLRVGDRFLGQQCIIHNVHHAVTATAAIYIIDAEDCGNCKGGGIILKLCGNGANYFHNFLFGGIPEQDAEQVGIDMGISSIACYAAF